MNDTTAAVNPYQPPRLKADDQTEQCTAWSYLPWLIFAEYQVESLDGTQVGVQWTGWSGLERYFVDGEERLRNRSFSFWGVRRFETGGDPSQQIEVRYSLMPWWRVEVWVGEERVVDEVFPLIRAFFRAMTVILGFELFAVAVVFATLGIMQLSGLF